jgi:hypothetical protein
LMERGKSLRGDHCHVIGLREETVVRASRGRRGMRVGRLIADGVHHEFLEV